MADIYRYLAQSLSYPQAAWFDKQFISLFFQIVDELDFEEISSCRTLLSDDDNWLEGLQVEYTKLFINAVPHVLVPPYASVYLNSQHPTLYSDTSRFVEEFYGRTGFKLTIPDEPPDYIVYELHFMALLVDQDTDAFEEFVVHHFRPWFILFRDKLYKSTTHPYYILAVKLINYFTAP